MRLRNKLKFTQASVLIGFVALSILAHGLLFLFQSDSQNKTAQALPGNRMLNISLVSDNASSAKPGSDETIDTNKTKKPEQLTVLKPTENIDRKTVEQTTKKPQPESEIVLPNHVTTAEKKSEQKIMPKMTQRNYLLGEIQHRLSQYLSYPVRAQRRGWQGEVMIGFHVDKHGFLHNVRLTQTSGYSLLDKAALNAIGKVKNIPLSSWLEYNSNNGFLPTALQLPVSYQLTNG